MRLFAKIVFKEQKVKDLLDMTSEDHTLRAAKMMESALKFVSQSKERFGPSARASAKWNEPWPLRIRQTE